MEVSPPRGKSRPPLPSASIVDSLPPEILEKIVSHLPLRDAVRTSAISRAWRRLWESAPGLALEWDWGADTDPAVAGAVLARCSAPVRSFCFDLLVESFWRSDDWVPLLAAKGVQILKLNFSGGAGIDIHYMDASIFSCRGLTCLHLSGGCEIPAAPSGLAGFPKLTCLSLRKVGFPDNGVRGLEALIAESPLLEVLRLGELWFTQDGGEYDHSFEQWTIQAPNLRILSITSYYYYGWQIEELPSIKEVEITSSDYPTGYDFVKLITRFARVKDLCLEMPCKLREVNVLEGLSCSFENLKKLTLQTKLNILPTILSTLHFLKNAPYLETLHVEIMSGGNTQEAEVSVDLLNAHWIGSSFANLRTVIMDSIRCRPNEMHFIEFVLFNAPQLRELRVLPIPSFPRSIKANGKFLREIAKYRKASPQARLVVTCHPVFIMHPTSPFA
ncbi:unnamed protein product [Urochloa decumbens]|uniref:F-box domain-containing protein n=1 Tax=Urochloa decumbens TaxID=240449 RepID=A0ABC9BCW2_9POAL